MNTARTASRLPNAPLVEVTFELQWHLPSQDSFDEPFDSWDPAFGVLRDAFEKRARLAGLSQMSEAESAPIPIHHLIHTRFTRGEPSPHPSWQLGPGVFVASESTSYDWVQYKQFVLDGVAHVVESFPRMDSFALQPSEFALAYVDSFDPELTGHTDTLRFMNEYTTLSLREPEFIPNGPFSGSRSCTIQRSLHVKDMGKTYFSYRLGNATYGNSQTILLESRVVSNFDRPSPHDAKSNILEGLGLWLESAHGLTSPFFKAIINKDFYLKFREEKHGSP